MGSFSYPHGLWPVNYVLYTMVICHKYTTTSWLIFWNKEIITYIKNIKTKCVCIKFKLTLYDFFLKGEGALGQTKEYLWALCFLLYVVVVQLLSHVWIFPTLWTAACQVPCPLYLPEFAQTHAHWVSDAIQPSHPLSPPSPLAFNLSQHQDLFQKVNSSHQVAV